MKQGPEVQPKPKPEHNSVADLDAASLVTATSGLGFLNARQRQVLTLQRQIGNRSVVQRIITESTAPNFTPGQRPAPADPDAVQVPDWASATDKLKSIQQEMKRLGMYGIDLDGVYGKGTDAALVESFGGDEFRTMDADSILTRLKAAKPNASGTKGAKTFRYGELFKDGILDMTLGIGHMEENEPGTKRGDEYQKKFLEIITGRGFVIDRAKAAELYTKAGRTLGPTDFGDYYVKENALSYTPPAGEARSVHMVIRLVNGLAGGQGAAASGAFKEGMAKSDITYYAGHGRYGSGPDFDRNFDGFDILDEGGQLAKIGGEHQVYNDDTKQKESVAFQNPIKTYGVLEEYLNSAEEVNQKHGKDAWERFMWRVNNNRINVHFSNEGNVFLNPENHHGSEFGGKLMYWALAKTGTKPAVGKGGELDQAAAGEKQRRYRMIVFDGCTTKDYEKSIRETPHYDNKSTELIETRHPVYLDDYQATLAAFLDSIIGQQSAPQTFQNMEKIQVNSNRDFGGQAIVGSPNQYDPTVK